MNYPQIWEGFVSHFEEHRNSPVLVPILKKTTLSSIANGVVYISCENLGMKIFLETKKGSVETELSQWIGEEIKMVFFVKQDVKRLDMVSQTPLLRIESSSEDVRKKSGLHASLTFDNFAVSTSNQIAYSAAQAVAENPGPMYNPLFIYGSVGVGKTHLMQAIANKILDQDTTKKIYYCSSEEFTNDLVESIRNKKTASVRAKYRNLNVFLVDDIQFIAGKNYVQEEFYHTFNTIIRKGGQVIMTSDRHPKEIKKLEDRLRSRFSGGLTLDIQQPDFELRTAILLIKARERNIELDIEVAKAIADRISDTRELEGKLLEYYSKSLRSNGGIGLENVNSELFTRQEEIKKQLNPHEVLRQVCSYYDIKPSHIKSPSRRRLVSLPRQVIMYILRTHLSMKYEEISLFLKRRDHTTILHGVDKITKLCLKNPLFKSDIDTIIESVQ